MDLSNNDMGEDNSNGTQAIGQSLRFLTNLQTLNLGSNKMGYTDSLGVQAIGRSLRFLTGLQTLSLGGNYYIGNTDSNGTQAIGESLRFLTNLQTLNLGNNLIGLNDSNGTQAIGESLRFLTGLQILDLEGNSYIGSYDSLGVQAIGQSLRFLTNLQTLNLEYNNIGFTGSEGTAALIKGMSYLSHLQTLNVDRMVNVTLPEDDFGSLVCAYEQQLQGACTRGRCFGQQGNTSFEASGVPPYLPVVLQTVQQGQAQYAPGYEPKVTGHGVFPGVQTSSSSRLSGPFWMDPVKAVWRWGRSWKESTFEKADQMWEGLTNKIVAYASEVVESTPHYHTPLMWSYDEDGRIDGVLEGSGRGISSGVSRSARQGSQRPLGNHVSILPSPSGFGSRAQNVTVYLNPVGY